MNGLLGKIIVEILILWVCYALYMELLVRKRGPVGGIFFYPKVKAWKMPKLVVFTVPAAAIVGGLCRLVGRLAG